MRKFSTEIGKIISGFRVEKVEKINELQLTAFHLKHAKTGAQHFHISKQDSNNVFRYFTTIHRLNPTN